MEKSHLTKINQLEFATLELAWEGINEYMVNQEQEIAKKGGGTYGTEMVSYDNFIRIYKPYISPDYNFGEILGYRYKKWSKLINNYVDLNYLDLVKNEVTEREKKASAHYNYTFHFDNAHGSGKDCLISLSFCRRRKEKNPYVIYTTRASEVTSRLIFDFLLIQRMCEYVYGVEKAQQCDVLCYIPFMYVNVERYLFYMAYKGKKKSVKKHYPIVLANADEPEKNLKKLGYYTPFQERCNKKYDEFMAVDAQKIKYKVHRRSALQIQKDPKTGRAISGCPDLFAKDLTLPYNPKYKDRDIEKLNKGLTIK